MFEVVAGEMDAVLQQSILDELKKSNEHTYKNINKMYFELIQRIEAIETSKPSKHIKSPSKASAAVDDATLSRISKLEVTLDSSVTPKL